MGAGGTIRLSHIACVDGKNLMVEIVGLNNSYSTKSSAFIFSLIPT
jgi:hypothetical protein